MKCLSHLAVIIRLGATASKIIFSETINKIRAEMGDFLSNKLIEINTDRQCFLSLSVFICPTQQNSHHARSQMGECSLEVVLALHTICHLGPEVIHEEGLTM